MMHSDSNQSIRKYCEFALGPLRWRFASVREVQDREADAAFTPEDFIEQLRYLIDQALRDGCTPQEVNTILSQHIHGGHHGDA